jgi:hypothetical protein
MAGTVDPPPYRPVGGVQTDKFGVGQAPVARQAAITSPTGGATIDSQARTAIDLIITRLEVAGLITPN